MQATARVIAATRDSCVLLLPCTASADLPADWQLVLSRLVLVDVELNPPIGSSPGSTGPVGPTLWPLNAFQSVGTALVMQDVRLVIPSTVFRQYLEFFRAEPFLQSNLNTTLHTVRVVQRMVRRAAATMAAAGACPIAVVQSAM